MASPDWMVASTRRIWRIRVRCIAGRFWAYNSIAGDDLNAKGNIDSRVSGAILEVPHWHQNHPLQVGKIFHKVHELRDPNLPFFTKLQWPRSFQGGEFRAAGIGRGS